MTATRPTKTEGATLHAAVARLESTFVHIARTRMADVALCHPGLRVQAVGFAPDGGGALGVLVTPWFMNLVWLPLGDDHPAVPAGATRLRTPGGARLLFVGAHEPGLGGYEACSLFSPMAEFADQAAAVATADEVLLLLRRAADAETPGTVPDAASAAEARPGATPRAADTPSGPPARRQFLFGRGAPARQAQP